MPTSTSPSVRWQNPQDNKTGESTRAAMVDWIDNQSGVAKVQSSSGDVDVLVVQATPPYIRTHANGKLTDNLLALPRF